MEQLAILERELQLLDAQQLRRRRRVAHTSCAPHVTVDGRRMLAFCSNDYLGLASDPHLVEALCDGASRYGVGSGGSHLISGHSYAHALLEERFAEMLAPFLEMPRALYFCTGYMANLAVLTGLAGKGAELFCEEMNHASLIDGARLAHAHVKIYAHGDADQLERLLQFSIAKTKVVVTDSVFSMDGDLAQLPQLLEVCERYDAWLVVDDAHGFGVLGANGCGALEHFKLRSARLVYIGTLGKAAGVSGAFVAAHDAVIEWLLQSARPYIYTTAAPPALAHVLLTSVALISGAIGEQRRAHLQDLIRQFQGALRLQRWKLLPSQTAIQPVVIGGNEEALDASAALYDQGIWIPAIRPPTVPNNTARLRITLSAAHSKADVAQLADNLNTLEQQGNA